MLGEFNVDVSQVSDAIRSVVYWLTGILRKVQFDHPQKNGCKTDNVIDCQQDVQTFAMGLNRFSKYVF